MSFHSETKVDPDVEVKVRSNTALDYAGAYGDYRFTAEEGESPSIPHLL